MAFIVDNKGTEDKLTKRVDLVCMLIDSFNNSVITKPVVDISIKGCDPPIRKKEGYYVFTNIFETDNGKVIVEIDSGIYQKVSVCIDLRSLNPLSPIVKILLNPSEAYSFTRGTTFITGTVNPFEKMVVYFDESTDYLRLFKDVTEETLSEITLFLAQDNDYEGSSYVLIDSKNKNTEVVTLAGKDELKYKLDIPLKHTYKKTLTKVYPATMVYADKDGKFFAALPFMKKEYTGCVIMRENDEEKKAELAYGKLNRL